VGAVADAAGFTPVAQAQAQQRASLRWTNPCLPLCCVRCASSFSQE
jgi:hypothetical protein